MRPKSPKKSQRRSMERPLSGQTRTRYKITTPVTRHDLNSVLDPVLLIQGVPLNELRRYPVRLVKVEGAGTGLIANKNIKKSQTLAYYKMRVFPYDTYVSPTEDMYAFAIYTKGDNISRAYVGDITPESAHPAVRDIPYWAYFANEPSRVSEENAEIDVDTKGNYKSRDRITAGDYVTYKLVAARNIKKGEPIAWCYGGEYERPYLTECADIE